MPRDDLCHLVAVSGEHSAQVGRHGKVPGLAVPARHGLVGHLAQHLLGEAEIPALGRKPVGADRQHLAAQKFSEPGSDRRLVLSRHGHERFGSESRAQNSCLGHHRAQIGVQGIQPGCQKSAQPVGHRQRTDVADECVHAVAGHDDVAVNQGANGLDGEQGYALGLMSDGGSGDLRHAWHEGIDQGVHGRLV